MSVSIPETFSESFFAQIDTPTPVYHELDIYFSLQNMTFSFLIVTLPHYTPIRICNTVIQFNLIPKELELLHTTEDIDKIHQLLYYITLVPPTTYFTSHNCTQKQLP